MTTEFLVYAYIRLNDETFSVCNPDEHMTLINDLKKDDMFKIRNLGKLKIVDIYRDEATIKGDTYKEITFNCVRMSGLSKREKRKIRAQQRAIDRKFKKL